MKTKTGLLIFILLCALTIVKAQYPIPSYNIDVTSKATFEQQRNQGLIAPLTIGKKDINISGHIPSVPSGIPCAVVWLYTLDKLEILGPYELDNDEVLQVPVDERDWGVYIEVSMELSADVWIDGGL
jgi:hypothetical protein